MGAAAAPVIMGLMVSGATVYSSIKQSEAAREARENAKRIADSQMAQQKKMQEDAQAEMAKAEAKQNKEQEALAAEQAGIEDRDSARARQRAKAKGAKGRSDTILTGPLGIVEEDYKGKTLLGG